MSSRQLSQLVVGVVLALVLIVIDTRLPMTSPEVSAQEPSDYDWIQFAPANVPPARFGHGLVHDSQRQRTVMFGGQVSPFEYYEDTWEFDGTDWSQVTTIDMPPARSLPGMIYDASRKRTVLFGGISFDGLDWQSYNDTWEYDGANWVEINTSNSPPARSGPLMVYDSTRNVTIMCCGLTSTEYCSDTWEYDGSDWTQIPTDDSPSSRAFAGGAFDAARNRVVLFGGLDTSSGYVNFGDTWEYDGGNWHSVALTGPSPRRSPAMYYNSVDRKVYLFGGELFDPLQSGIAKYNDTWEYNGPGSTWNQITTLHAPSERAGSPAAFIGDRAVLFGGQGETGVLSDTWILYDQTPPPISTTVTAADGGVLISNDFDRSTTVQFPREAVVGDTIITYAYQSPQPTDSLVHIDRTFHLTATQNGSLVLNFNKPVTVTVRYGEEPAFVDNLRLHWLSGTSWITDGITTVAQTDDTITSTTSHFTLFAVLGEKTTSQTYLPLILKRWPPIPDIPVLNAIDNDDGDGNYTVMWNVTYLAETYTLEEDDNAAFSSPYEYAPTSGTSQSVIGKTAGTYYYRVKATNSYGDSGWSNVRSVIVPVLVNGGFEGGPTGWTQYSTYGRDLIVTDFPGSVAPRSGTWAVWLGEYDDETSIIGQQVTVPSGRPYLIYWHWIVSDDECGYDVGGVGVNGKAADTYWLCGPTETGGWVRRVIDLRAYTGQSILIEIMAANDESYSSDLFIDDMSFQSSGLSMQDRPNLSDLRSGVPKSDQIAPPQGWTKDSPRDVASAAEDSLEDH
jgi:hypothetical protein